jgi:hypothetical protein
MHFLGEDENSASGHAFGYKTAWQPDKPFRCAKRPVGPSIDAFELSD